MDNTSIFTVEKHDGSFLVILAGNAPQNLIIPDNLRIFTSYDEQNQVYQAISNYEYWSIGNPNESYQNYEAISDNELQAVNIALRGLIQYHHESNEYLNAFYCWVPIAQERELLLRDDYPVLHGSNTWTTRKEFQEFLQKALE